MFVLFNKNLNRFFKHPKIGIWWTHDNDEANKLLAATKEYVVSLGFPELAEALIVQEITEDIEEIQRNEDQAIQVLRSQSIHGLPSAL